ncbi:MAG: hypothetical protein EOL97_09995, partial [Spirochaetia bacterium]|nr:hypothetical protein [Spirochaetia bacterium]
MLLTEYKIQNNKPVIFVYGRNQDGSKYVNTIKDFKPYFYVLKGQEYLYSADSRVVGIESGFTEIYGREVTKIIVENPYDIRELSQLTNESFEADIDLNNRYAIDLDGEIEKEPIAVCYIDIETDHDKTFPTPRKAAFPITAITCYNSLLKKMITFAWRSDLEKSMDVIDRHLEKENIAFTDTTLIYNNEREMLDDFLSYINDTSPDIMTGWNCIDFDIPYIIQRIYNIAMDCNRLSPMGIVTKQPNRMDKDKDDVSIKGRVIFDLLTAYKKMNFKGLESFKLDNIGEKEVGEKKVEYEGTLANLWRTQFDKFIEYNKKDVELLIRIDYKRKLIESYDEVRRMSKCKFEDLFESMKVIDTFILSYCKQKNIILPTKHHYNKENFAGATVLPPKKGLHEYVSIVDASQMYPAIIMSLNASPETISPIKTDTTINLNIPYLDIEKLEKEIAIKSHRSKIISDFGEFFVENWNIEKQKFNCNILDKFMPYINYKKVYYNQDKIGLLKQMMLYLGDKRKEIKNKRDEYEYGSEEYDFYERKQYAAKILNNSFYGSTGANGFRLYSPEIAPSITYMGRNIILKAKRSIEEKGYDVIMSDSDSLGFQSGNKDTFIENSENIQHYLNSIYDEFSKNFNIDKHYIKFEFEKTFEKVLFGDAKKRYAGKICYYKGKEVQDMLIMGFEMVRSDCSRLAKQTQKQVFDMLFLENKDRKEITKHLRGIIGNIRANKYSYDDLAIPTPLNKPINEYTTNLPIVRAVEYSNNELELDIRVGEKIKMIYVKGNSKTDVIGYREMKDLPKVILDYDYHIKEAVTSKMERIFS